MNVKERIHSIRLMELSKKHPETAKQIGVAIKEREDSKNEKHKND